MSRRDKTIARLRNRKAAPAGFTTWWNGQPTHCTPGYLTVQGSVAVTTIPVVQVDYFGDVFYLDNSDGSAWRKVSEGHGNPRWPHRDVEGIGFRPTRHPGWWKLRSRSSSTCSTSASQ